MENNLASLLRDFAQGASNSAASNVAIPVDAIAWLLRKSGVNVPPNPVMGSDWMAEKGLTREPKNKLAGLVGDMAGMVAPFAAAAKAPQIAKGLLAAGEAMPMGSKSVQSMSKASPMADRGAIVWHGSTHKFAPTPNNPLGEFDFSKIGTGEGAQAYGHGGYLGGAKETGQTYTGADGYLYKVDLPDEHIAKMLDYNLPINQQSPQVLESLKNSGILEKMRKNGGYFERDYNDLMKGEAILSTTSRSPRPVGAKEEAEALRQAGITGIKYLDGGSRVNGSFKITPPNQTVSGKWMVKGDDYNSKGMHFDSEAEALAKMQEMNNSATRNYVVFPGNERLLKILERNGQSLP